MSLENGLKFVFIGGVPRSGTTLLGAMLGNVQDGIVIPEAPFKEKIIDAFNRNGRLNFKEFLFIIRNNHKFQLWGIDISEIDYNREGTAQDFFCHLITLYAKSVSKLDSIQFVIDHSPDNLEYASKLSKGFDHVSFIHIIRDVRGVFSSIRTLDWGPNDVFEGTDWWLKHLSFPLLFEVISNDVEFIRIKYESLVLEPETTLKHVCKFFNFQYQKSMMTSFAYKVPKYSQKQHDLVGKQIQSNRISGWKTELSEIEIAILELRTRDMLMYFGYELMNFRLSRKKLKQEYIKVKLNNFNSIIISKINNFMRRYRTS